MWASNWRADFWSAAPRDWDLIVVGGGITGAGILREASRRGLRALLVEKGDFASGTSSRSSKLVHGGLRYLGTGEWRLTLESVRERQHLLNEGHGLIDPLDFVWTVYDGQKPGLAAARIGLGIYDIMAGTRNVQSLDVHDLRLRAPRVRDSDLLGGFVYQDAETDDSRLVLRVIVEARMAGAMAVNHVEAESLLRDGERVTGVRLRDRVNNKSDDFTAAVVVNATGPWTRDLLDESERRASLRPLRGSHIMLPAWRMPLPQAVSWLHHQDHRPVMAFPWEGATLFGTTDLDHDGGLNSEPRITAGEVDYLVGALQRQFPGYAIQASDILSTYAGVRPIVDSGADNPSDESRESVTWRSPGLLTVTGGKLTTFRVTAVHALREAADELPPIQDWSADSPILDPLTDKPDRPAGLGVTRFDRLCGRFGAFAGRMLADAARDELQPVGDSPYCAAEFAWSAAHEAVEHLDDLMLRRTRMGMVAPNGGLDSLEQLRPRCQLALGWNDSRWEQEVADYRNLWLAYYAPPDRLTGFDAEMSPTGQAQTGDQK